MPKRNALPEGLKEFALDGKTALVIGAEHPLGHVAALTLAEAGAHLLLASQQPGTDRELKDLAKTINNSGGKAAIQIQSASIRSEIRLTIDRAVKQMGSLDIAVTALDHPCYGPAQDATDADYDRVMEENFKTVWVASQEAGRAMLEQGGGVIVHLTSIMAERGVPNAALYCSSKGAVRNLCRALALEWARARIRVNLIECGWLDEPDSPAAVRSDFSGKLIKYLPYRRLLKPDEIAGTLLYLVSPAASFVTGDAIAIDGGLLCRV
jgi:NAD(P)-dependent dehydrogenase (short-subunit alcohol dehydrogenase family)